MATLRDRLRAAREDERITAAEVDAFIRSVLQDGKANFQEALILRAELEAHGSLFEPEARRALESFLDEHEPRR